MFNKFLKKARVQENAGMTDEMGPSASGGDNYEDFIPKMSLDFASEESPVEGFSSPDETAGKRDTGAMKRFIPFAITVVAALGLLVGLYMYVTSPGTVTSRPTGVDLQERQEMEKLAKERELQEKITLLESQNQELLSQISQMNMTVDERITERMAAILEELQNQRSAIGSDDTPKRIEELQAEQRRLREQLAKSGGNIVITSGGQIVEKERKEGSSSASVVFNTIGNRELKQRQEEQTLKTAASKQPSYDVSPGVPTGTNVPAELRTMMISSTLLDRFHVVAEMMKEYEFMPGIVLPKGVKFIGKAKADFDARRIIVDINMLQYGTAEIKMQGVMLDGRANPGMVSKYTDPLINGLPLIFLSSLLSSTASAAQDMTSTVTWAGTSYEYTSATTKNILLEGTADTLDNFSNVLTRIYSRQKPVIQVYRNIPVYIQFTEKMPLSTLMGAGVARYKASKEMPEAGARVRPENL